MYFSYQSCHTLVFIVSCFLICFLKRRKKSNQPLIRCETVGRICEKKNSLRSVSQTARGRHSWLLRGARGRLWWHNRGPVEQREPTFAYERLESLQSRGLSEDCPTKSNKIGKSISRKFVQIILIPAFQSRRPCFRVWINASKLIFLKKFFILFFWSRRNGRLIQARLKRDLLIWKKSISFKNVLTLSLI